MELRQPDVKTDGERGQNPIRINMVSRLALILTFSPEEKEPPSAIFISPQVFKPKTGRRWSRRGTPHGRLRRRLFIRRTGLDQH